MLNALGTRLYARLWLAVIATVVVLTLLTGWVVRMSSEAPLREVVVRGPDGTVVGRGTVRLRPPEEMSRHHGGMGNPRALPPGFEAHAPHGHFGPGPEFVVEMNDGQVLHVHMPRASRAFLGSPANGLIWMLGLVAVAVALGTYPIVRRLTRRLEQLQQGVEQWATGDLSARVAVQGRDEVGYLAERFNHAAQHIEQLVQSHKTLLANASHELRTPLTRIRMGLELMGERPSADLRAEIERNIAELDELIGEILLASRLDSAQADVGSLESVDLTGLASEECARAHAELDLGEQPQPLFARGVPRLLQRLLRNLLENARRYAGSAGVQVHLRAVDAQWLELRVCDQGPGVPADQRERIFEPFYRLPGASEREGGVGLGLALVKSITQRHGGSVRCEDAPGGGACFVVRLPRELA